MPTKPKKSTKPKKPQTTPVAAAGPVTTNKVHVTILLDRSGSMQDIRESTISGVNEYINTLRTDKETEYDVSLIQFDTNNRSVAADFTQTYENQPLSAISDLTLDDFQPRGSTPLYDAIGYCINRIEMLADSCGRAVIILIITDGMENSSKKFTHATVKTLIQRKQEEGWTITFLGAGIDSYKVAGSIGVAVGNTANFVKSLNERVYTAMAQSTVTRSAIYRDVGIGGASIQSFFDDSQKSSMGDTTVKSEK